MDIRVFTTVRELEALGLISAYIEKFHSIPIDKDSRITLTLEQAQNIGMPVHALVESGTSKDIPEYKPTPLEKTLDATPKKRARKAK